jgi:hypothetical protein
MTRFSNFRSSPSFLPQSSIMGLNKEGCLSILSGFLDYIPNPYNESTKCQNQRSRRRRTMLPWAPMSLLCYINHQPSVPGLIVQCVQAVVRAHFVNFVRVSIPWSTRILSKRNNSLQLVLINQYNIANNQINQRACSCLSTMVHIF